jgi:hypothetical protein
MLSEMTARQLIEWQAFSALEPFGVEHARTALGMIYQLLLNVHRDSEKRSEPYRLEECLVGAGDLLGSANAKPAARQSWQQMQLIGRMMASATW